MLIRSIRRGHKWLIVFCLVVLAVQHLIYSHQFQQLASGVQKQRENILAWMSQRSDKIINACDCEFIRSRESSPTNHTGNSVLVLGAITSDIGLSLVKYLHKANTRIFALDIYPPDFETGLANWYELRRLGIKTETVSDPENWKMEGCTYDMIVYTMHHLSGEGHTSSANEVKLFKSFVIFMEKLALLSVKASVRQQPKLYLVSAHAKSLPDRPLSRAWLNSYEKVLDYYRNMYGLPSLILKVSVVPSVNGDAKVDSCLQCNNDFRLPYLDSGKGQIVFDIDQYCKEASQCEARVNLPRQNVIMSTCFTEVRNPQYIKTFRSSRFRFIQNWLQTASKYNASIVIFHDSMSEEFQERLKQLYQNVDMVRVTDLHGRAPNDYRYYLFYEYLVTHPSLGYVLMTDIRDVDFLNNPFQVMDQIGSNYLYMGLDIPFYTSASDYHTTSNVLRRCHIREVMGSKLFSLRPNYNAGVVGGSRGKILSYLHTLLNDLDQTPPGWNCNMASLIHVTIKYFQNDTFSGFPFQCPFKSYVPGPQGCAVRHKYA